MRAEEVWRQAAPKQANCRFLADICRMHSEQLNSSKVVGKRAP